MYHLLVRRFVALVTILLVAAVIVFALLVSR